MCRPAYRDQLPSWFYPEIPLDRRPAPPSYPCPRCWAWAWNLDDPAFGWCPKCWDYTGCDDP